MDEQTSNANQDAQPAPTGTFSDAPVEVSGQPPLADEPAPSSEDSTRSQADAPGNDSESEPAVESPAEPALNEFAISGPLAETSGYISSSFGLNLTGKAAHNLARLLAGLQRASLPVNDGNAAINWLLEQI